MTLYIAAGGRKAPFTFSPAESSTSSCRWDWLPRQRSQTVYSLGMQLTDVRLPKPKPAEPQLSWPKKKKKKNTECSLAANSSFLPRWLPVSGKDPLLRSFAPRSCPPGALPLPPGLCRSFLFPADSLRRVGQVTVTVQPQ